jgi:hypothetical protein
MSSKIEEKKMVEMEQKAEVEESFLDISKLIIPFSVVFKKAHSPDIYTGDELIPFEEKDSEFKEILIHEFLTVIKKKE